MLNLKLTVSNLSYENLICLYDCLPPRKKLIATNLKVVL